MNINILVCYRSLFTKIGIIHNIGFYIINIIAVFHIISFFIFLFKQFIIINKIIEDIIYGIKNSKLIKSGNKKERKRQKKKNKKEIIIDDNNINNESNNKNNNKINKKIKKQNKKKKTKYINISNNNKKNIDNINSNFRLNNNYNLNNNEKIASSIRVQGENVLNKNNSKISQKEIEKVKNIMQFTEDEMNSLSYELALENDKRSYCIYYISLLRTKHNIIFSFCNSNDYNSKIIKQDLFFVSFGIYYTVNALFLMMMQCIKYT